MKNLIIFAVFVMVLLVAQFAQGQTIDEIVQKNIDAMGGKEKLAALKTVKMEGNINVQGNDVSLTLTRSHMVGARLDLEVMGMSNYQLANNTKGTVFMPVTGVTDPQDMDADQYKSFQNQMDVQGALFNYKEKGHTVEYIGTEKVGDADAYKLKITFKNGKVGNYFIDTKTNRLIKSTGKTVRNGQEIDVENSYTDYKQNADGYWFPYTTTSTQGTTIYDKISTNIPVDEAIFKN